MKEKGIDNIRMVPQSEKNQKNKAYGTAEWIKEKGLKGLSGQTPAETYKNEVGFDSNNDLMKGGVSGKDPEFYDKKRALESYREIKEFVKGTLAENSPIIPISAQQGINIDKILEELCKIEIPERDEKSDPIFLVARSFDINKPGT